MANIVDHGNWIRRWGFESLQARVWTRQPEKPL